MIIMKEQNGTTFQFRAFQDLPAVSRFFEGNNSGKVYPKTLYDVNMDILPQNALCEDQLDNWTPINSTGFIGFFEIISSECAKIELPKVLKWYDGRSNTFGKTQEFTPQKHLMPH